MIYPKKNLPFTNVVASGVASLELPLGMTYQAILLEMGGTTFDATHITRILAKINGKPFQEWTGSDLDKYNDFKGRAADAAYLMLDFAEVDNKTIAGSMLGGVVTSRGVSSFTLEVTISGATAPTLESYSVLSDPPADDLPLESINMINAVVKFPKTFSAAGKFPVVLPYGRQAGHLIKRVGFFGSIVTALEVKKNGAYIFEQMAAAPNTYLQKYYEKTPQSNLFVYDAIMLRNMGDTLNTGSAQTLQFDVTVSGAGAVDIYMDVITRLANL